MNQEERKTYLQFEKENFIPFHQKLSVLESTELDGQLGLVRYSSKGDLLGILPYYLKKKIGFSYITHPPMIKWMGPLLSSKVRNKAEVISKLLEQIPDVAYFEQNFSYQIDKNDLPNNYIKSLVEQYSYRIENIRDLDSVYNEIYPDYRNNKIKKAERVLEVSTHGTIEEFIEVHHQSFSRQGMAFPVLERDLKAYIANLIKINKAAMLFARDKEKQIHSVALLTWDEQVAYYHMAGDDVKLRKSGSGIYLCWKAIEYASVEKGLHSFDFEGSMLANVERVRKRFGASKKNYVKIQKYNSLSFKLLQKIKRS